MRGVAGRFTGGINVITVSPLIRKVILKYDWYHIFYGNNQENTCRTEKTIPGLFSYYSASHIATKLLSVAIPKKRTEFFSDIWRMKKMR